jgi:hypothetical protein
MRRKFHLLNSPKYFSISEDYGLFGVSERNLNQLANIWKEDIVFYYTAHKVGLRTSGFIHGPFEVISELFYNDKVIWAEDEKQSGKDKYPYRIKFEYLKEHTCLNPIPIQIFWDLKEEGKIKTVIDSSALIDKAVITLLNEEGILLLQALLQANPKSEGYTKEYKGHNFSEKEVDLLKFSGNRVKEFVMESYLEAYLLRNPKIIHNLSGFGNGLNENYTYDILNQVSTYIAGGAIDIVCLYKKKVLDMWLAINATVFELKKGIVDPFFVDQLIRYIEWTGRLIPGVKHRMIKGILVGRDFGNQTKMKNELKKHIEDVRGLYSISCYTYSVSRDNKLVFNSLED